ncbi:MAG: 50S ribosomal protein L15 [Alphaproteobacteria bacterium]|nr:MAG: 50S ribosomal protein L15 [Alphaproteobacteria bacterium]
MRLNELKDNPGARKRRKRVGRGPGSGMGKTSGRGIKGAKARSGTAINGYEGGQMPIYRRLPKRGFDNSAFARRYVIINLGILEKFIERGRIDPAQPVTEEVLRASGAVGRVGDGVRLLAKGRLTRKLDIEVTGASRAAIAAVEALGGTVTLTGVPRAAE